MKVRFLWKTLSLGQTLNDTNSPLIAQLVEHPIVVVSKFGGSLVQIQVGGSLGRIAQW